MRSNPAVDHAVYRAVAQPVYANVYQIVSRNAHWALHTVEYRDVDRNVHWAVNQAVNPALDPAVYENALHPGLELYFGGVGR